MFILIFEQSVETRLENRNSGNGYASGNGVGIEIPLPKVEFEVLDWKNLRISLQLSQQLQKLLSGRRLQFRIRDRERGDSDWYSIKQTFVRIPQISSITCTNEMNGMCELKGNTIDYISQVSIDGGQSWYPQTPSTLQVQSTQDGQKLAMIPLLPNKKLLMIKLRDFPNGEGLFINGFSFSNSVKGMNKSVSANGQGQMPNQPIQPNPNPLSNQPKAEKARSSGAKTKKKP